MPKHTVRLVKFSAEEMAIDAGDGTFKENLVVGRGIDARLARGETIPTAKFVAVDDETLSITLVDGRKLLVPLAWYPRLKHGTPSERNSWRLLKNGIAILWRNLEQVINVESALAGERSREPAAALRKWLDGRQPKKVKKTA